MVLPFEEETVYHNKNWNLVVMQCIICYRTYHSSTFFVIKIFLLSFDLAKINKTK